MDRPIPFKVLILASDEARAGRFAQVFSDEGPSETEFEVSYARTGVPRATQFDVIVQEGEDRPSLRERLDEVPGELRPGVIRIGAEGPADVHLPGDATWRELRLACRLLGEIARLRRKLARGKRLQQRLAEAALTDPLSGLPNRRAWDEALIERLADAGPVRPVCVAVVDLDHFKRVNDRHGHVVGDAVLRAAGAVLREGLRQEDFVARLGGDEFGLLLALPDAEAAGPVLDRVRRSLPGRLARAGLPEVTASAGYCLWLPEERSPPLPSPFALFATADTALRQAKHEGRDRVVRHDIA